MKGESTVVIPYERLMLEKISMIWFTSVFAREV